MGWPTSTVVVSMSANTLLYFNILVFFFQVLKAFSDAEKTKLAPYDEAYKDVYDKMTPRIQKQLDDTKAHVNKYKEHYNLDKYESN